MRRSNTPSGPARQLSKGMTRRVMSEDIQGVRFPPIPAISALLGSFFDPLTKDQESTGGRISDHPNDYQRRRTAIRRHRHSDCTKRQGTRLRDWPDHLGCL